MIESQSFIEQPVTISITRAGKIESDMVALSQTWKPATQRPHFAQTSRQTPHDHEPTSATPTRTVLRARYYDPSTGEFTSPDPLEYVDGMSLYRGYFAFVDIDPIGRFSIRRDKNKINNANEANDWCKKVIDWRKEVDTEAEPPKISDESNADCQRKIAEIFEKSDSKSRLSKIFGQFNDQCKKPPIRCECCKRGSGGNYWDEPKGHSGEDSPGGPRIVICWNNLKDDEDRLIEVLTHEGTHALQDCYWKGEYNCGQSLKWELEAYRCADQCRTFEECLFRAIQSSCGSHCLFEKNGVRSTDGVFTPEIYEDLKKWFGSGDQLCTFPRKPDYPPKTGKANR
jgi:RHS repeat-associated protein